MSTSPTVTPAPPTGASSYSLTALATVPLVMTQPAAPAFNPALPAKYWADTGAALAVVNSGNPNLELNYDVFIDPHNGTAPAWTKSGITIPASQAAYPNVPPVPTPPAGSPLLNQPGYGPYPVPTPSRNLIAGVESLQSFMGGDTWVVVNSANVPAGPAASPNSIENEILANEELIEQRLGITPV